MVLRLSKKHNECSYWSAWIARYKFSLYEISNHSIIPWYGACAFIVAGYLQIFSLLIRPEGEKITVINSFAKISRITPLFKKTPIDFGEIIGLIISFFIILFVAFIALLKKYNISHIATCAIFWVALIPITESLISVFNCEQSKALGYLTCWSGYHIGLCSITFILLSIWIFEIMSAIVVINNINSFSNNSFACRSSSFPLIFTILRVVYSVNNIFKNEDNFIWISMILDGLLLQCFFTILRGVYPFYNKNVSQTFLYCSAQLFVSIILSRIVWILEKLDWNITGLELMHVICIPLLLPLAFFLYQKQRSKIFFSNELCTPEEVDLLCQIIASNILNLKNTHYLDENQIITISRKIQNSFSAEFSQSLIDRQQNIYCAATKTVALQNNVYDAIFRRCLIIQYCEKSAKNFEESRLKIMISRLYLYLMGNVHKSFEKMEEFEEEGNFFWLEKNCLTMEIIACEKQNNKKNKEELAQFVDSIQFESLVTELKEKFDSTARVQKTFWETLSSEVVDYNIVYEYGIRAMKDKQEISTKMTYALQQYPQHPILLRMYLPYLWMIREDFETENSFLEFHSNNKNKIKKTYSNSLLIVSVSSEQFGTILKATEDIGKLFGVDCKVLEGKNIDFLMPQSIGKVHNSFMENFIKYGKKRNPDSSIRTFGMNYSGFLFPIRLTFYNIMSIKHGLLYIARIEYDQELRDNEFLLINLDNQILGVSEGLSRSMNITLKMLNNEKILLTEFCKNFNSNSLIRNQTLHFEIPLQIEEILQMASISVTGSFRSSLKDSFEKRTQREENKMNSPPDKVLMLDKKCEIETLSYPNLELKMLNFPDWENSLGNSVQLDYRIYDREEVLSENAKKIEFYINGIETSLMSSSRVKLQKRKKNVKTQVSPETLKVKRVMKNAGSDKYSSKAVFYIKIFTVVMICGLFGLLIFQLVMALNFFETLLRFPHLMVVNRERMQAADLIDKGLWYMTFYNQSTEDYKVIDIDLRGQYNYHALMPENCQRNIYSKNNQFLDYIFCIFKTKISNYDKLALILHSGCRSMKYANRNRTDPDILSVFYDSYSNILSPLPMKSLTLHYTMLVHFLKLFSIMRKGELPTGSFNYKFTKMFSVDIELDVYSHARVGILDELIECSVYERYRTKVIFILSICVIMLYVALLLPCVILQNYEVNVMLKMLGNFPARIISTRLKYIQKFLDTITNVPEIEKLFKLNSKIQEDVCKTTRKQHSRKSSLRFYGSVFHHISAMGILSAILIIFFYMLSTEINSFARYMENMISLLGGLTRITFCLPMLTSCNYHMVTGVTNIKKIPIKSVIALMHWVGTTYSIERMVEHKSKIMDYPDHFNAKFNHIAYGNMCELEPMKSVPNCSTMVGGSGGKGSLVSMISIIREAESFFRDYYSNYTNRSDLPALVNDMRLMRLDRVTDVLIILAFGEIEYHICNANSTEMKNKSIYILGECAVVLFILLIVCIGSWTKLFPYMSRDSYNVRAMLLTLPQYVVLNDEKIRNFIISKQ